MKEKCGFGVISKGREEMSEYKEKIYCGNAKVVEGQYGDIIRLSITADDLKTMEGHLKNGWVNLNVLGRKTPSKGGMTHSISIDTWEPKGKPANIKEAVEQVEKAYPVTEEDDLPF